MKRFLLPLFLVVPLTASAQEAQPTPEQQQVIKNIIILGRVQAACSFFNGGVLAPAYAKQFIERQLKVLPDDGKAMRAELVKNDTKCATALQ